MYLIGVRLPPVATVLAIAGTVSVAAAIFNERRMQRHRQPGVTYAQVTWRKDGGWRRADLFTPAGLAHQRLASRYGLGGVVLWIAAVIVMALSA